MAKTEQIEIDRAALAQQEFEGVRLGDVRRERRLQSIAGALAMRANESLPVAMGDHAGLLAAYRLLGKEEECVSPAAILRPHIEKTHERCRQHERVLAVFDTTELRFPGERKQLGALQHGGRGMLAHIGLAVSADGRREALGTLHLETLVRSDEPKARKHAAGEPDNERLRWHRAVQAVYKHMPEAVCVMDREADVLELMAELVQRNQPFVIRATHNRNTPEGPLFEQLDGLPKVSTRRVELTERRASNRASQNKSHPPRSAHTATLDIRARAITLRPRPSAAQTVAPFRVHLVQVTERNPPPGEPPVSWMLLTNLPIASQKEVDFIVDAYSARWVIEDFFKALKSGCAIEKRQLESVESVTNMLAISLPIAWLLLRLRNLSRDEPNRPAKSLLSPLMLHCLRVLVLKQTRRALAEEPTCKELAWAIAGLGGHIKNNGEPGLIVLGRGMDKLLLATELAGTLGVQRCDQS